MQNDEKLPKIIWYTPIIAFMVLEYLFLTKQYSWPLHDFVELDIVVKIYNRVTPWPRYLFLISIIIELLSMHKEVVKRWKLFVGLFVPTGSLFFYLDVFVDKIVVALYPATFIILFYLLMLLKAPKKPSVEKEDLNLKDFELDRELTQHPRFLHLRIHNHRKEGWLTVPNPFRGIIIVGKAGSGKTYSTFESFIFQQVMKGWVIYNYDYKFPDFTNHLQTCLDLREKAGLPNYPHYIINFDDPSRTHRINPIHPDYIEDVTELSSIATTFIQNIKPEWVKNKDFWADAAITYFNAIMLLLYLDYPDKCTFPHVIEMASKPYQEVLPILLSNKHTKKIIVSYVQAVRNKADQQLAGMSGSLQVFLPNLSKPDIYWTLSGNDVNLEFKNPQNPCHISIGNTPGLKERFLQPLIGSINKIALTKANRNYYNIQVKKGIKNPLPQIPGAISFDELVTTYVEGLDQVPNVGRSNLICLMIGIQLAPQLIDRYGREKYEIIIGSFGNYFIGLCDPTLAEMMSKLFGQKNVKVRTQSVSKGADGKESTTINHSIQREPAVPVEELTTQPSGHLYGMVTNEADAKRDMTADIEKPFFKGYVLFKQKNYDKITSNKLKEYTTPINTKILRNYMIPEFAKFSDSDDYKEKVSDMKMILDENYEQICDDVDKILAEFEHRQQMLDIEAQERASVPPEQYLKNMLSETTTESSPTNDSLDSLDDDAYEDQDQDDDASQDDARAYFSS